MEDRHDLLLATLMQVGAAARSTDPRVWPWNLIAHAARSVSSAPTKTASALPPMLGWMLARACRTALDAQPDLPDELTPLITAAVRLESVLPHAHPLHVRWRWLAARVRRRTERPEAAMPALASAWALADASGDTALAAHIAGELGASAACAGCWPTALWAYSYAVCHGAPPPLEWIIGAIQSGMRTATRRFAAPLMARMAQTRLPLREAAAIRLAWAACLPAHRHGLRQRLIAEVGHLVATASTTSATGIPWQTLTETLHTLMIMVTPLPDGVWAELMRQIARRMAAEEAALGDEPALRRLQRRPDLTIGMRIALQHAAWLDGIDLNAPDSVGWHATGRSATRPAAAERRTDAVNESDGACPW